MLSTGSSHVPAARLRAAVCGALLACAAVAAAQDAPQEGPFGPRGGQVGPPSVPTSREAMWRAPTAEDWAKPCLITWQRTWEDAVAVAHATGKPILVCVNMDGEIASEHYAGVRYREPETAKLYEPYVTVIASVYRHTPTDFDEQGRRIPCPRFGGVTCGEHIALEPVVYEKFLDGRRIAPRHIMVEPDDAGSFRESFDVYYANDTASVFQAIEDGIALRGKEPLPPTVKGDRPVVERVASRDVDDRRAVEAAYAGGDAALRRDLLRAALAHPEAAPLDLLRLAVFGLDTDLAKEARAALAKTETADAAELISDALRAPMADAERETLLATLDRLGKTSQRAWWLAVVQRGLSGGGADVDPHAWSKARSADAADGSGSGTYDAPQDWYGVESEQGRLAAAARTTPDDPALQLDLAEKSLAVAIDADKALRGDPRMARAFARHYFDEARRSAQHAGELGSDDWRVTGVQALVAYYGGTRDDAYPLAEEAVRRLPPGDGSWNSMALLTIYGEGRWRAIQAAVREKREWPSKWLADLHSAYSILLEHPLGNDAQVAWHFDILAWLRARDRAREVLDAGLRRFPNSSELHARLRRTVLRERGVDALEAEYERRLAAEDPPRDLEWFAGYASTVAAEFFRGARNTEKAVAAYGRSIEHFERALAANPSVKESVDRYVALALAGRARVRYQVNEDAAALDDVLASFARDPGAAGTRDGAGITPGETAQMLLARLREKPETAEAGIRLEAAMGEIDPELLRPDRP